jgi:hypothetical protein
MAHPGIVLIKRFTYRGSPEEWANIYHFVEAAPTTGANWKTMVDALAGAEKAVYPSTTKIVRAYCYDDTDNDSVSTVDYTALGAEIPGTYVPSTPLPAPGDAAMWIRWATAKRNSKGKTVYLRKYFHGVNLATGGGDAIDASQVIALGVLGRKLSHETGFITGFTICGPDGTTAGAVGSSQYATTRTLKRRGKRPPT